jgi:hypothetical protein
MPDTGWDDASIELLLHVSLLKGLGIKRALLCPTLCSDALQHHFLCLEAALLFDLWPQAHTCASHAPTKASGPRFQFKSSEGNCPVQGFESWLLKGNLCNLSTTLQRQRPLKAGCKLNLGVFKRWSIRSVED